MIPGLNTKVNYAGAEYHIQTEDLGRKNPFVLTLVFRGGAIVAREKVNYLEALGEGGTDDELRSLMAQQHRRAVESLVSGQIQEAVSPQPVEESSSLAPSPSVEPMVARTRKGLDELIAEYLQRRKAAKPR